MDEKTTESSIRWALAIVLLGCLLRFLVLPTQSLTVDEVGELLVARGGWREIVFSDSRFPPFYHLSLAVFARTLGEQYGGRLLSLLCGVGAIGYAYKLGRLAGGERVAAYTAALVAAGPFFVWYSHELRMYGMFMFLVSASLFHFFGGLESRAVTHRLAFVAASTLGIYTHYYFGVFLLFLWLAVMFEKKTWRDMRVVADFCIIAVLALPAGLLLKSDLERSWGYARTSTFSAGAFGYTYFAFLSGYGLGPSLRELHSLAFPAAMRKALPWLLGLAAASAIVAWNAVRSGAFEAKWKVRLCWLTAAPVLFVGVMSRFASFGYNIRHVAWCAIPMCALAGMGICACSRRSLRYLVLGILCVCFATSLVQRACVDAYRNEDIEALSRYLSGAAGERAPVLVISGYMSSALRFYLGEPWTIRPFPSTEHDRQDRQQFLAKMRAESVDHQGFWLVYSRQFHDDPEGEWLRRVAGDTEPVREFAGARLYWIPVDSKP